MTFFAASRRRCVVLAVFAVFLGGCVSAPVLKTSGVALLPAQAASDPERWRGNTVVWGGEVIEVRNREHESEIVVLAYPLDDGQRPRPGDETAGRFIAVLPGYVESYDYPAGRFVTIAGTLEGRQDDLIGEQSYPYPLVRADETHLWPVDFDRRRWHVAVGVSGAIR